MNVAQELVAAVGEQNIARQVLRPFDDAVMQYRPPGPSNVTTFEEYEDHIGAFYNYLFSRCIAHGGTLPPDVASVRAKEIIEQESRRHGGDIVSAFNDARDGTNNNSILAQRGMIAENLKREAASNFVRAVFDHFVKPCSYQDKVQVISAVMAVYGPFLGDDIDTQDPGRYAHDYQRIVHSLAEALQRTGSVLRRL
jgi:hypothetical protein